MNATARIRPLYLASRCKVLICLCAVACSSEAENGEPSGGGAGSGGSGASVSGAAGREPEAGGPGAGTGGGDSMSTGGAGTNTGGSGTSAGGSGGSGAPAAGAGAGGSSGAAPSAGGSAGTGAGRGGAGPEGGSAGVPAGGGCAVGAWPEADPSVAGPFATVTETNVGPAVGEGEEGGAPVAFTLFRPMDLDESGRCHPVITWGNGTGSSPSLYGVFLRHLASHGFVVIASDSPNVARGNPPPMVAGVSWLIEQNAEPASPLYGRIDTAHVGATGHSQGGFATTTAGGDSQITTIAPLCGAGQQRNLHGPAFFFCGGEDTVATCDNIRNAFEGVRDQPALFGNYLTADHADWITFRGMTPSPVEIAVTAWMRVQLMGDTALRSWFYGPDCRLCQDSAWEILQKELDQ